MAKGVKKIFQGPVSQVDDSDREDVGTIRLEGDDEYLYLKGVVGTVIGSLVAVDKLYVTTLASTALATPRRLAVSKGAIVANKFGWYQVRGVGSVDSAASNAEDAQQYLTATAGRVDDAVVANKAVIGMRLTETVGGAAALASCQLNHPHFEPLL